MPTHLLPRKAEDVRPTSRFAHAGAEERERRAKWRAQIREEPIEPESPIIDAHHHLWARPNDRYYIEEFLAEARTGHNVRASVFVECGSFYRNRGPTLMRPVGEVEFANGIAAMAASGSYGDTLVAAGIVGTADLTVGAEVGEVLDAEMAVGGGRFKGIRLTTKWDPDDTLNTGRYIVPRGLMQHPDFRAGFAMLAARQLSFDAMIYHPQIHELADLARAFAETPIIVNHIGGLLAYTRTYVSRKEEAIAHWRASMSELAKCPNVYVKLGGLGMSYLSLGYDQREKPASSAELAQAWGPLYEHCIQSFGPQRCMFESNFPPDRDSVDYPVLWNAMKRIAAKYYAEEKHALFHDTAAKVYRLRLD